MPWPTRAPRLFAFRDCDEWVLPVRMRDTLYACGNNVLTERARPAPDTKSCIRYGFVRVQCDTVSASKWLKQCNMLDQYQIVCFVMLDGL